MPLEPEDSIESAMFPEPWADTRCPCGQDPCAEGDRHRMEEYAKAAIDAMRDPRPAEGRLEHVPDDVAFRFARFAAYYGQRILNRTADEAAS